MLNPRALELLPSTRGSRSPSLGYPARPGWRGCCDAPQPDHLQPRLRRRGADGRLKPARRPGAGPAGFAIDTAITRLAAIPVAIIAVLFEGVAIAGAARRRDQRDAAARAELLDQRRRPPARRRGGPGPRRAAARSSAAPSRSASDSHDLADQRRRARPRRRSRAGTAEPREPREAGCSSRAPRRARRTGDDGALARRRGQLAGQPLDARRQRRQPAAQAELDDRLEPRRS